MQNETKSNNKLLEHLVVAFADESKKVNTQATPNTKVMNPKGLVQGKVVMASSDNRDYASG